MDKVSIVVPVYNKEACLARCVDSVLAQKYADFTLILVDDGSKDGSLALCRRYEAADHRIRVVAKENGGVSTARNAGIDASTGEYILFLDADDWWEPDFLETMIPLAQRCGRTVMPMCAMFYCGETARPVLFSEEAEVTLGQDGIYEIYRRHYLNMLWNKVFLGDIIRQQEIRFPVGIHWGEDKLFILEYLRNISGYHILNRPLYHYDVSDGGLDTRFKADELQLNEMLHQALFTYEQTLENPSRPMHLMLCREYMRVQVEGAFRQVKLGKSLAYAGQLRKDRLLYRCMEQLEQAGLLSRWMCFCQKYSGLLLIVSHLVKKKLQK